MLIFTWAVVALLALAVLVLAGIGGWVVWSLLRGNWEL